MISHGRRAGHGFRDRTFLNRPKKIPGHQFVAKDFKEFVRVAGLTHVKTSPYYPQTNGKIERWHKSLKADCIRPGTPLDIEQARRPIAGFVDHYNTVRLHSAIGYITPENKLLGKEKAIFADRDQNSPRPGTNEKSNDKTNPPTP
jgi:transposase InsO family protein